jgi:tripartite-type tricarboxylate transporter receptor subunit TctC
MEIFRRQFLHLAGGAAALFATSRIACAQAYLSRPVRIIVNFPPGGINDTVARLLGDQIRRAQGQTILIENRAGAGGAIGAEAASHAAPDGSTLVLASTDIIIPSHLRKLNYDLLTGFEPICHLVSAPSAIVVNSASPYRTLDDLLNAARVKPGDLTAAAAGQTAFQIAFETLKRAAKVEMTFVPYPGAAAAVNALLGGHVTSALATYSTASGPLSAGQLRALASLSRTRIEALPEVPTVAEFGYPDSEMDYWVGMLAPAKTPKEKISQLTGWFTAALQAPELRAKLAPLGLYSSGICGADFAALLRKQYDDFGRVIREANILPE